jgi:peptide/nickel transport system permease protein
LREQAFVEAARSIGAGPTRILARHIIPNLVAPLIVMGTFIAAAAMLTEAYLSFLGAGVPSITPSWGNIMAEGRGFISKAMWVIFFPGLVLAIAVTAINLAGDGIRDILDPKLARRM